MQVHRSVTAKRLERAATARLTSDQDIGFCIACGRKQTDVEVDARGIACANTKCGKPAVYSAEEILMEIA